MKFPGLILLLSLLSITASAQNTGTEQEFFAEEVAEDVAPPTQDEVKAGEKAVEEAQPADIGIIDPLADDSEESTTQEEPAQTDVMEDTEDEDEEFADEDEFGDDEEFAAPIPEPEPEPDFDPAPQPQPRQQVRPTPQPLINAGDELTIVVEPSNAVSIDYKSRKARIRPYSERRRKWGSVHGFSVGTPSPDDFEPNFITDTFENIYSDSASAKIIEYHSNYKRNFGAFSLGFEFNVGTYNLTSNAELIDSVLTVTYAKIGGQLALDNLFAAHPYIVIYGSGGIQTFVYSEKQGTTSNNGNTEVSFYGSAGLMFDISWLDKHSADAAYFESGIENTFVFVEATFFTESQNEQDPNFAGLNLNAGIKVEF